MSVLNEKGIGMEAGPLFPQGPKNVMMTKIERNQVPGPGDYEDLRGMSRIKSFNQVYRGEIEPEYRDDRIAKKLVDLDVPGPGTYDLIDRTPSPSARITVASPKTKQYMNWKESRGDLQPPSPVTYEPSVDKLKRGVKIGSEGRGGSLVKRDIVPAPNAYHPVSEFEAIGEHPKFAQGYKFTVPDLNAEKPGPGTYPMQNRTPMSQKNVQFSFPLSTRVDEDLKRALKLPGVGDYDIASKDTGPMVR